MDTRNIIDRLGEEVTIPDCVQRKADAAFAQIRRETAGAGSSNSEKGDDMTRKTRKKTFLIAMCAAMLAVGGVTAAAANLFHWSRGVEEGMQVTPEQKSKVESTGLVANPADEDEKASTTVNGVTVTAEQTLVDDYYAYVAIRIEGLTLPEDKEPSMEYFDFQVDDMHVNMTGGFYDGLISDASGKALMPDGSLPDSDEDGHAKLYFQLDDGSYEFHMYLNKTEKPGSLFEKNIVVSFTNFGYDAGKQDHVTTVEGTWNLEWTLHGSNQVREVVSGEKLGDSGATLKDAAITPISIMANLEWPFQTYTEVYEDENGEEKTSEFLLEPPHLTGLRLKDGTLLIGITHIDTEGYQESDEAGENRVYHINSMFNRIIDPDEVDALLFIKDIPEGEEAPTEDDLYIIPVK